MALLSTGILIEKFVVSYCVAFLRMQNVRDTCRFKIPSNIGLSQVIKTWSWRRWSYRMQYMQISKEFPTLEASRASSSATNKKTTTKCPSCVVGSRHSEEYRESREQRRGCWGVGIRPATTKGVNSLSPLWRRKTNAVMAVRRRNERLQVERVRNTTGVRGRSWGQQQARGYWYTGYEYMGRPANGSAGGCEIGLG
jgi:hypothetical protein